MNLQKLFDTQKVLRDRIGYDGEDRFEKLILALLVEIGECANEFRGFKFWSKDQEPRKVITVCSCCGNKLRDNDESCASCEYVGAPNEPVKKYPLLEEYVDGLHFILELGIELDFVHVACRKRNQIREETIIEQFIFLTKIITEFLEYHSIPAYLEIVEAYIGLGEMLGFTWEQIEEAYFEKNKINHERQNTWY